jgi:hypothetical protein
VPVEGVGLRWRQGAAVRPAHVHPKAGGRRRVDRSDAGGRPVGRVAAERGKVLGRGGEPAGAGVHVQVDADGALVRLPVGGAGRGRPGPLKLDNSFDHESAAYGDTISLDDDLPVRHFAERGGIEGQLGAGNGVVRRGEVIQFGSITGKAVGGQLARHAQITTDVRTTIYGESTLDRQRAAKLRVTDHIQFGSRISRSNPNAAIVVDKHSLGGGSGPRVRFEGQLTSTIGLRYPFDAGKNRLGTGKIDEPILEERRRFRCWIRGCVDFQSKAAQGLIDRHEVSLFFRL